MSAAGKRLRFTKMHGAGNDFVIVDCRVASANASGAAPVLDAALAARLGDRHRGVGFDQLLSVEDASGGGFACRIFNADGSAAMQCGNGVRCLAAWLVREGLARVPFVLHSPAGPVGVDATAAGDFSVTLQVPEIDPEPHATEVDGQSWTFTAVSMGNPHAVIEVADCAAAPVARVGAALQRHPCFPDRCNVGFAEVTGPQQLRLRVFERGVGETQACGSGACAAAAVMIRSGRVRSPVEIELPGGTLRVAWEDPTGPVHLSGPAAFVFEGEFIA